MRNFVKNEQADPKHLDMVLRDKFVVSFMDVWHEVLWQPKSTYRSTIEPYLSHLLLSCGWVKAKRIEIDDDTRATYHRKKGNTLFVRKPRPEMRVSTGGVPIDQIRTLVQSIGGKVRLGPLIEKVYGIDLKTYPHEIGSLRIRIENALRASSWEATGKSKYKGFEFSTFSRCRRTVRGRNAKEIDQFADILG